MLIKQKSIIKGVGSFAIKKLRESGTGEVGAFRADGSYAIFMRHVASLARIGCSFKDKVVVEFGPGSSFGIGFAALLCGARRYYAFDLVDHTSDERNIRIFDSIVAMLRERRDIPLDNSCARIFPFLEDYRFPADLLPDALLREMLDPARVEEIRNDLIKGHGQFIRPKSTSNLSTASIDEHADIILSESVLEHVDDLHSTYAFFRRNLAANGIMLHLIDYTCHRLSPVWNGHWSCSPFLWSLVRGRRSYLINRMPHQTHLDLLHANGLKVIATDLLRRVDGLTREQFAPQFRTMSYLDSTTALASITCRNESTPP